jgi:hypothetical protein
VHHPPIVVTPAEPADPAQTYQTVTRVLEQSGYTPVDENATSRKVRVRAHASDSDLTNETFINAHVAADGSVRLSASGALAKHRTLPSDLENELTTLAGKIRDRLGARSSSATSAGPSPSSSASGGLPQAWTEPAYDPKTWGDGKFTCVPFALPRDPQQIKLRLSNGENADVAISIAYSPGLCRSASNCALPNGCPALGLGDSQQVRRLAERLARGQVASKATIVVDGRPVSTLDLRAHGSINQALIQSSL